MDHIATVDISAEPAANPGSEGEFAALFARALAHHREGNLGPAQDIYLRLMTIAPNKANAASVLNNLGAILTTRGCVNEAIEIYYRSIALAPDNPIAYGNLGNIFAERGWVGKAEVCYRQAIRLDDTSAEAHHGLAVLLWQNGERSDAVKLLELATRLDPTFPDAWYTLGTILCEDADHDEAIKCLERYLELDSQDRCGAAIPLARLGAIDAPANTPHHHLVEYYQSRALAWDQRARQPGIYVGFESLRQAIVETTGPRRFEHVLDIGCGTGLCGEFLRPIADVLDGVDLSPQMLALARGKGLYDQLRCRDLEHDLGAHPQAYDLIVGAAVLIHFGELAPVFCAVHTALRPGGAFAFTLFRDDTCDHAPTATSFFTHSRSYVEAQSANAGFAISRIEDAVHEYRDGQPLPGLVVVLKRPTAA